MKRIDWNQLDAAGRKAALARPQRRTEGFVTGVVREIFDDRMQPLTLAGLTQAMRILG